jgi:hypothetical protein
MAQTEHPISDLQSPISDLASGVVKNPDTGRVASNNIRLSAALWALGFPPRLDAQPCERTIEFEFKRRENCAACRRRDKHEHIDVIFWHAANILPDAPVLQTSPNLRAIDVLAWWKYPAKYSIEGFDDALTAMRRVFETREWLLQLIKGGRTIVNQHHAKNAIVTGSLRSAAIIKACGFDLIGFENVGAAQVPRNCRFIFPAKATRVAELIERSSAKSSEHYSDRRADGRDLCIDWMLWALEYHSRLMQLVRQCGGAMIEMRDGERVCRFHSQMPKTLRREVLRHF